jgi:SagB-type dehydrogenase family enzyme
LVPSPGHDADRATHAEITLPPARLTGGVSLESAILRRRSTREFADAPLSLDEVAQLLWSAQGVTDQEGHRAAPSAGALYPLEVYLVVTRVEGLAPGVYHYWPASHTLTRVKTGEVRRPLAEASLGQSCVGGGVAHLVFSAVYERTTDRYGERGTRYVHMDVGHAGQNVHLQAEALGLGTVVVAAFDDERVREVLGLPTDEHPLYIMPVGRR